MDKETNMLTEARLVEIENAAEANSDFVETITASAAQTGTIMTSDELSAWLSAL